MKSMKKLTSFIVVTITLSLLADAYKNSASKYEEAFEDASVGVKLTFNEPKWSENLCTFPEMEVLSDGSNTVNLIQISYSGEDTGAR